MVEIIAVVIIVIVVVFLSTYRTGYNDRYSRRKQRKQYSPAKHGRSSGDQNRNHDPGIIDVNMGGDVEEKRNAARSHKSKSRR
jgi:hypothetical protein